MDLFSIASVANKQKKAVAAVITLAGAARFTDLGSLRKLQVDFIGERRSIARLAQSVERKALNLVVVGSSPTVGVLSARQWAQVCSV